MVFEMVADEYRLMRLQFVQAKIELRRDLRSGQIFEIYHTRSRRRFHLVYQNDKLHNVFVATPTTASELVATFEYEGDQLVRAYDCLGLKQSYTYDENGCITKISRRNGTEQTFEYDARLRCVRTEGKDGFESRRMVYDEASRTTYVRGKDRESIFVCNPFGQVVKETQPNGAVTRRAYDARGNLIFSTGPLGNTIERKYDVFGRLTDIIRGNRRWTISYDGNHHITKVKLPNGTIWQYLYSGDLLETSIGPHGHRWMYGYNLFGELMGVRDPLGHSASRTYDEQGNVIETTAGKMLRKFSYDHLGRIIAAVNESGYTSYQYDAGGR